jgi:hypothetical protein
MSQCPRIFAFQIDPPAKSKFGVVQIDMQVSAGCLLVQFTGQPLMQFNTLVNQPNRLDCGGARLSGNRSADRAGDFSSRCVRIFLMITGSSMQAMTFADPPQMRYVSTSVL